MTFSRYVKTDFILLKRYEHIQDKTVSMCYFKIHK